MIKQLSPEEAAALIAQNKTTVAIIDVRDAESYARSHIEDAIQLPSLTDMAEFCFNSSKNQPVLVYCYHGISSQAVAQYLQDQGFLAVYSLAGGYEKWQAYYQSTSDNQQK